MTEKLTRDMIEAARLITEETGGVWTDQLRNTDQLSAYRTMAEEIWTQTDGRIDGFVQSVGTSASFRGLTESLRQRNPRLKAVAVEPAESAVLSGGTPGAHKIDGIGAGFVVPLWRPSTGANVIAATRLAEELGPDATVVTIMCDTGMKYFAQLGSQAGL
jgi:cysteine synthase A